MNSLPGNFILPDGSGYWESADRDKAEECSGSQFNYLISAKKELIHMEKERTISNIRRMGMGRKISQ